MKHLLSAKSRGFTIFYFLSASDLRLQENAPDFLQNVEIKVLHTRGLVLSGTSGINRFHSIESVTIFDTYTEL